ncbi:unnamed protein product [Orchesella dallaii]|uniref:G-protein coupled receptors family 2 profile 1 domain-containing protein n=1 Tax=Orchesella dallaii TaxID=48710 RepID=A0ABP1QZ76_9HEXA
METSGFRFPALLAILLSITATCASRGVDLCLLSNDSNYDGTFCPVDWDELLCWPRTAVGEVALLPCFDSLNGIAYDASGIALRLCLDDGIWNAADYSSCRPLPFIPHQVPNITTHTGNLAITTGMYLFGFCVTLIALIIAALVSYRNRARILSTRLGRPERRQT